MSDVLRPDIGGGDSPENTGAETLIPHSGHMPVEAGGERPVFEFDNTGLGEAAERNLITTPDSLSPLAYTDRETSAEETKSPLRRFWKPLAVLATVATLGAGLLATRGNSNDSPERPQAAPAGAAPDFEAPDFEVPVDNVPSKPETSSNPGRGNVNLVNEKLLENGFITAVRPNGEEIKVARLGGDTPEELASSALGLFACYATTGSPECKMAFSSNPGSQASASIERFREDVKGVFRNPKNADTQIAVFDDPKDPAVFTTRRDATGRGSIIEQTGGTLYIGRYHDLTGTNEWQGPETRASGGLESKFHIFNFSITSKTSTTQDITVSQFNYDVKQLSS